MHKRKFIGKGFTLVEILLALAILGIGLVSVLSLFVVGSNSVRRALEKTEACFVAQMVFEDFKRQGHANAGGLTIPDGDITSYYNDYSVSTASPANTDTLITLNVYKNARLIETFYSYITAYEP